LHRLLAMTISANCLCEERSDEAIPNTQEEIASLARHDDLCELSLRGAQRRGNLGCVSGPQEQLTKGKGKIP